MQSGRPIYKWYRPTQSPPETLPITRNLRIWHGRKTVE